MDISLIIPVYDEEENLPLLFDALYRTFINLGDKWEIIFIDDGSTDRSYDILKEYANRDPAHIKVISFRRNFGQTAAIAAGIDNAHYGIIAMMDADLQNDPEDIPRMIEKISEGFDVVSGWRKKRNDAFYTRTLPSRIASKIISWVTGLDLHDFGCTLKVYRKEVLSGFRLYGEMHRFIPVYAKAVGAKITELQVLHHPRKYGKAKYGLERSAKVILDLVTVKFMTSYMNKPIYIFGGAGLALMLASGLLLLFLAFRRIVFLVSVLEFSFIQYLDYVLHIGLPVSTDGLDC